MMDVLVWKKKNPKNLKVQFKINLQKKTYDWKIKFLSDDAS